MHGSVLGIIAPHPPIMVAEVGKDRARVTAESSDAMAAAARLLAAFAPDTIVLMSPHAPAARDAFLIDTSDRLAGDLGQFGAPQVRLAPPGDPQLALAIIDTATGAGIPVAPRSSSPLLEPGALDHGSLVPLSFLDRAGEYPLVVLSLSFLPLSTHRTLGSAVRDAADRLGRRVAFLASGDCSHRLTREAPAGFSPRGAEFDRELLDLLEAGDFEGLMHIDADLIDAAGECGLRSFVTLGGFLEGSGSRTRVLAYEGPWGVGYTTAVAASPDLLALLDTAETSESPHPSAPVALARRTIETFLREHRIISPPEPEGLLQERRGAFVSLHRHGELRGCIGTIAPTTPSLAEEIVHNAIQAATADPRFPPMTADELDDLEISVDVLGTPEPASMEDLDPSIYGVIVSADWRRGLLLPDLDGVDTAEQQVAIARQKAGIGPDERITIERFRVDRYH
ncbi:MAG TPA: AMMECR1 domain-containing protein [Coriobacteriia bacterium]|nr:MAG: Extradiol ring-cleavage dioxygenase, class III enzyme, subunit B [Actinobacteria bacterium 66_15]HAL29269.1 AMMECR1 domain-containing protein [Coriobacteriia bacterium]